MITKLFAWYGKRTVIGVVLVAAALLAVGLFMKFSGGSSVTEVETATKIVSVKTVSELQGGVGDITIVGTLEARNEARLQTESAGRVTAVHVKLGDRVSAGAVLASIENSSEAAAVLQAQGSYEAAIAGASAGGVSVETAERSVEEAKIGAKNAFRSAFTVSDDAVRNLADELFSNPDAQIPGLKIDGDAPALTQERVALGKLLVEWRAHVDTLSSTQNGQALLSEAENNTKRVSAFITTLASSMALQDADTELTEADISLYKTRLAGARAQLDGTLSAISGARNGLNSAESGLEQAKIAGADNVASLSDAQVKQALGSLRLAQSSYEKTIIRTPISGTVNALSLKVGTFVGMQAPAAVVSNEGGLEVKAYVTEDDIKDIRVGDAVTVEKDIKGVVTQVGSALDPETKKIEIRVGIDGAPESLTNGQSVTLFLTRTESEEVVDARILLPITSIKMTPDGAVIFTVTNENKLVSHTVVLGAIIGNQVVVEEGVTKDMRIVLDARGLRADEIVEIK